MEQPVLRACACTFDGTVPAQLSLRSPVTGAPHRGAGSSDGRLLLGIYGKWQLPQNKTEAVGEGKTTEVPNRECTGLTLAEIYFLRSAWQFGWKCAIHTFRPADRARASEREGAPPLIYFLCWGNGLRGLSAGENHISYMAASWWIISHFTYLPFQKLIYINNVKGKFHSYKWTAPLI